MILIVEQHSKWILLEHPYLSSTLWSLTIDMIAPPSHPDTVVIKHYSKMLNQANILDFNNF